MADDRNRGRAWLVILTGKIAPYHGMNAEDAEGVGTDPDGLHHLHQVAGGDVYAWTLPVGCQIFESAVAAFGKAKPRVSQNRRRSRSSAVIDLHDSLRLWIRQRAKQHGVDHCKEACVSADADGQCQDCHECKRLL